MKHMLLALLFAALLALSIARSGSSSSCTDPLSCYLADLSFVYPKPILVPLDGMVVTVTQLTIHGLDIHGVPSLYSPPTTLSVQVQQLGSGLSFHYSAQGTKPRPITGDLLVQVKNTNVTVDLDVGMDSEGFPVSLGFTYCDISPVTVIISQNKLALAPDPDLPFSLDELIQKLLDVLICDKLNTFLTVDATTALVTTIDPKLHKIVDSVPTPYPVYNHHYLSWNSSIIQTIHNIVGNIKGFASLADFLNCITAVKGDKVVSELEHMLLLSPLSVLDGKRHRVDGFPLKGKKLYSDLTHSVTFMDFDYQLDTLCDLEILEPIDQSAVTLRTGASFESFSLKLYFAVSAQSLNAEGIVTSTYEENVVVNLKVGDVSLYLDTVIAVDQHLLDSYYLDQMSSIGCWVNPLTELSVPNLVADFGFLSFSIDQESGDAGFLENNIADLVNNAMKLLLSPTGYGPLTEQLIAGVFQGPVRERINQALSDKLTLLKSEFPCLAHYPYDDDNDFMPWSSSDLITLVNTIVNEHIGYDGLNKIFSCASDGTGSFAYFGERLEVIIAGLNSFFEFYILAPVANKPYDLANLIGLGYCPDASTDCNPLKLTITSLSEDTTKAIAATLHTFGDALWEVTRHIELSVTLENFSLFLDIFAKIDKNSMRDLKLGQMGTTGCVASAFNSISFTAVSLNVTGAEIIYSDGTKEHDATNLVNRFLGFLTRESTIDSKNSQIAEKLTNAGPVCLAGGVTPSSTDDEINNSGSGNDSWKWELMILVIACLGSLAALLLAYQIWGDKRSPLAACLSILPKAPEGDDRSLWERCEFESALVFHPMIPLWVRLGIPAALLATISLFLQSNILPDSVEVLVKIHIADEKVIDLGSVFGFGLQNTVHDMWEAKVYPLAILIAFFSGAWPYIKLGVLMSCWFIPPALCSVQRRESLLIFVDALGKWSLIDFYVMMLMLCAFYLQMYIVANQILIDVSVKPNWGFYGFVLATMFSLGIGHLALACHRLVTDPKVVTDEPEGERQAEFHTDRYQSLSSMTFLIPLSNDDSEEPAVEGQEESSESSSSSTTEILSVKLTTFGKLFVLCFISLTALFVVAGMYYITMDFKFKGMVGLMLKDKAVVDYSYVSIGNSIPEHSGTPNTFGVRWLQAAFFLFGLGMPLGFIATCFVLWFVPMKVSHMRQVYVLSEVFNAWSAVDVFCVSIAAALLEIQQFAAFVIGDSCDKINVLLAEYLDPFLDGDDKCFDVIAELKENSWILFCAAGILLLLSIPTLAIGHAAIKQRLDICGDRDNLLRRLSREQVEQVAIGEYTEPLLGSDGSGSVGEMPVDGSDSNSSDHNAGANENAGSRTGSPSVSVSVSDVPSNSVKSGSFYHRMNLFILHRMADLWLVEIKTEPLSIRGANNSVESNHLAEVSIA